jgi:hypothetical protein
MMTRRNYIGFFVACLTIGIYLGLGCPNTFPPSPCPGTGRCSAPGPGCQLESYNNSSVWTCWKLWNPTARNVHHCTPYNSSSCSGKIIGHPECAEYSYTEANAQRRRCDNGDLVQQYNCSNGPERYVRFFDCSC